MTGAAGFIGGHVALEMLASGRRVTALDLRAIHPDLAHVDRSVQVDMCDSQMLSEVRAGRFEAVLHMAAISSTTERDWSRLHRHNVEGPLQIARACAESDTLMVYASSHSVYGSITAGQLVGEAAGAPLCSGPLNEYASSKLELDRAMPFLAQESGLRWVGLRFTNVFGTREEHKGSMASILSQILRRGARGDSIEIFRDTLVASRDYITVGTVARTCVRILEEGVPSDVYNLGSGSPVSFAALLQWCAELKDEPLTVQLVPNEHGGRYQYWTGADMTRLRGVLHELETVDADSLRLAIHDLWHTFATAP